MHQNKFPRSSRHHAHRPHKTQTVIRPVSRHVRVHMFAPQTKRTMVPIGPAKFNRPHLPTAMLTLKRIVSGNKLPLFQIFFFNPSPLSSFPATTRSSSPWGAKIKSERGEFY